MKQRHKKSLNCTAFKSVDLTGEQVEKIRSYLLDQSIAVEDLYVRKALLCHNAIDRDRERFSEALLEDFRKTLPGKGLLLGHRHGPPGLGLFFDADIEEMSLEEARKETGEELVLPDGTDRVRFLVGWFYTTQKGKEELLRDIDAGIARYVSIAFSASGIKEITDNEGTVLFREYVAPGEALEGSLVWLGAQPGAMVVKGLDWRDEDTEELVRRLTEALKGATTACGGSEIQGSTKQRKELHNREVAMKRIFTALGLSPEATEEEALKELNLRLTRLKTLEEAVAPLGEENLSKEHVEELVKCAEAGRKWREDLIQKQLKYETLLGRVSEDSEAQKKREEQLKRRTIEELKEDVSYLEKLVQEKFPSQSTLTGEPGNDKRTEGNKYNFKKKED